MTYTFYDRCKYKWNGERGILRAISSFNEMCAIILKSIQDNSRVVHSDKKYLDDLIIISKQIVNCEIQLELLKQHYFLQSLEISYPSLLKQRKKEIREELKKYDK